MYCGSSRRSRGRALWTVTAGWTVCPAPAAETLCTRALVHTAHRPWPAPARPDAGTSGAAHTAHSVVGSRVFLGFDQRSRAIRPGDRGLAQGAALRLLNDASRSLPFFAR